MREINSVFSSLDDFSDQLWPSSTTTTPSIMNRSGFEWELDQFLVDFPPPLPSPQPPSSAGTDHHHHNHSGVVSTKPEVMVDDDVIEINQQQKRRHEQQQLLPDHPNQAVAADSDEYRAFLRSQLDIACDQAAAIIMKQRDSGVNDSELGSGSSVGGGETDRGSISLPSLPETLRKQEAPVRQTLSRSSREDSDEDENEGDTESKEDGDPADARRARRMLSNRESARRSRRRKQEQLGELETQVGQLRDERNSLLSRFTDINQKCDTAAVDNRILKADIETLRAKVKMAEEQVKRVTGLSPMLPSRFNMPAMGMQFGAGAGAGAGAAAHAAISMQPNSNQFFNQQVTANTAPPHIQRPNNSFPSNTNTASPAVPTLQNDNGSSNNGVKCHAQHVQNQIGSAVVPGGALSQTLPKDKKK